ANFGVDLPIEIVESSNDIVAASDIINCSTRSNEPVFNGELLKEGTHVNGVGSFLPHMKEIDLTTIKQASYIVVDDLESDKEEAGELISAAEQHDWSLSDIYGEHANLVMNDKIIRTITQEFTFFTYF